jgi:iron complex transport system substrate-binding protein
VEDDEALATAPDSLPLGAEEKLTGDLVGASVCGYMLGTNDLTLDEVSDAAYVYAVWGGELKTVTDMIGRTVTLYRPAERIICTGPDNSRMVIALGDGHLLVGADGMTVGYGCVCPMTGDKEVLCEECWENVVPGGLNNLPEISTSSYETMIMLKPDLIILWGSDEGVADDMEERIGVPVFAANPEVQPGFSYQTMITGHASAVGAVLSREQEAEDLIAFTDSKVKLVTDIIDTIPESEKPRIYFALFGAGNGFYDPKSGRDFTCTTNNYYPLTMAGGINVARDILEEKVCGVNVALEQIIAWNPDVILISAFSGPGNDGVEFVMNSPELESVKAVQEGRVYTIFSPYCRGAPHDKNLLNVLYIAKILYPDKFADLDVEKEGNEIMAAFLGVDGAYSAYADYMEFPREQQI